MENRKSALKTVLEIIVKCLVPTIPLMIGAGMIKVLLIIVSPSVLNLLSETSDVYTMLSLAADTGYYFVPIFSAVAAGEVFGTNKFLAGMIGAMLLHPTYVSLVESGSSLNFFGLPVAMTNYASQVIPSLLAVWIMSFITKFLDRKLSDKVRPMLAPPITILLMVPILFCIIGPLGNLMGELTVKLILALTKIGPLGNAILCALIPYITVSGMGGANFSAMVLLAATGCDPILFYSNVMYNVILGMVTLALYFRNHKPDVLAAAMTSAIAGTSEPAIFGYVVKDTKALMSLTAGCFAGGLVAGLTGVKSYAMASYGLFGIFTTIGPESSIISAALAMLTGSFTGFMMSFMTHKSESR